jgi:hypothetical protein
MFTDKESASRGGKDPPASHVDDELVEEPKSPYRPSLEEQKPPYTSRPDPPAMQFWLVINYTSWTQAARYNQMILATGYLRT